MPWSNLPVDYNDFKKRFGDITGERKKIVDISLEVNWLIENDCSKLERLSFPKDTGAVWFYKGLVFFQDLPSLKRKRNRGVGSAAYHHPTGTMRRLVNMDRITKEYLDNVIDYSVDRNGDMVWEFLIGDPPWISALSQAAALELFSLGYILYDDPTYLFVCHKILKSFFVSWKEGGVKDVEFDWYIEYPMYISRRIPEVRRVLNCQTSSIVIFHRIYERTGLSECKELEIKGIAELKRRLPTIVTPEGKSYYSYWQAQHSCGYVPSYHNLHVTDIHRVFLISGDKFFKTYRNKMMKLPNPDPYYLTPHTVPIIEHRDPAICCRGCDPAKKEKKCPGCGGLVWVS